MDSERNVGLILVFTVLAIVFSAYLGSVTVNAVSDYRITELRGPNTVQAGSEITVSVKIVNVGDTEGNKIVGFVFDGTEVDRKRVSVPRDESKTVTFSYMISEDFETSDVYYGVQSDGNSLYRSISVRSIQPDPTATTEQKETPEKNNNGGGPTLPDGSGEGTISPLQAIIFITGITVLVGGYILYEILNERSSGKPKTSQKETKEKMDEKMIDNEPKSRKSDGYKSDDPQTGQQDVNEEVDQNSDKGLHPHDTEDVPNSGHKSDDEESP